MRSSVLALGVVAAASLGCAAVFRESNARHVVELGVTVESSVLPSPERDALLLLLDDVWLATLSGDTGTFAVTAFETELERLTRDHQVSPTDLKLLRLSGAALQNGAPSPDPDRRAAMLSLKRAEEAKVRAETGAAARAPSGGLGVPNAPSVSDTRARLVAGGLVLQSSARVPESIGGELGEHLITQGEAAGRPVAVELWAPARNPVQTGSISVESPAGPVEVRLRDPAAARDAVASVQQAGDLELGLIHAGFSVRCTPVECSGFRGAQVVVARVDPAISGAPGAASWEFAGEVWAVEVLDPDVVSLLLASSGSVSP